MGITKDPIAQKLFEAFCKLKKVNWNKSPVEGLTHSEILVLFAVGKKGSHEEGIKVSEISKVLKVASPTITQQINSLENNKFVERTMDKEDRRAVRIKLTEKGEEVIKKAQESFFELFNGLVNYLGNEKSNELAELLSKVAVYFNEKN